MHELNLGNKIRQLRRLMIESLEPGESHHIGCSFSILEIVSVLYYRMMHVNPRNPKDPKRDIFILSKGHGALAVYVVLCDLGFISKEQMMTYDRNGSILPEHIHKEVPGVEASTGSLGHGLPISSGFALSFKNDNKDNKVYVVMSDGELNEGSNWEAIQFAAHHNLSNLVAIIDLNGFQGFARTKDVLDLSPLKEKFESFQWNVLDVDGNDLEALEATFRGIQKQNLEKPTVVLARTVKAHGMPMYEGKFESHYHSIDAEMQKKMLSELSEENT